MSSDSDYTKAIRNTCPPPQHCVVLIDDVRVRTWPRPIGPGVHEFAVRYADGGILTCSFDQLKAFLQLVATVREVADAHKGAVANGD